MATSQTHLNSRAALARMLACGAALAAAAASLLSSASSPAIQPAWLRGLDADELELIGFAGHLPDSKKPKLTGFFVRESYPRGVAHLVITDSAQDVTVQVFRAGGESIETAPSDVMLGTAASKPEAIGDVAGRRTITVKLGDWPSGMYYAQLTSGNRIGYAPFVLRPRAFGEHRVAIVLPTETWQAYNFRDDNSDGRPDTWYFGGRTARLVRPFQNRGVPPHWKQYDAPFVRWLVHTGREVDYLSDQDLRNAHGNQLSDAYSLLIFSGHHEYVTEHEYDVVTAFRNHGGNLMFLAANNFFWKITIHHNVMTRVAQWRDLGRPEAALIGVQYGGNDRGGHRGAWILRHVESARWLFAGIGLKNGEGFSSGGIEIDKTAPSSPQGVHVLAEIPNLFGPGFTAQMTYYETPNGAKVFAAGAFSLAGGAWEPEVGRMLGNLWQRLAQD